MKTLNFPTSACRCCRYYRPEGRRGGACQQLGVPVRGSWKACSLAIPPFAPSWESIEGIWQDDQLGLKEALSGNRGLGISQLDLPEEMIPTGSEKLAAEIVLV